MGWVRAETKCGSVAVDAAIGNLRELDFDCGSRRISPLHTAHWVGTENLPADLPPVERDLAGDFFCAPFGGADVEPSPPHGWSANSQWSLARLDEGTIQLDLDALVLGALITKTLRLSPDAPLLYQSHRIEGGQGALTFAHHPMLRLQTSGALSVSPKRAALTPLVPLEPGRHALACPARSEDLHAFPAEDGTFLDLATLPIGSATEDFVTLVEADGSALGWSAVVRDCEDDIVFFLKDPKTMPVTMLWHSNGGRDYAPWSGRHTGVLGVEDGCAAGASGHRAALATNPVSAEGVPTAVSLGGRIEVKHVIGAVPRPEGWERIRDICVVGAELFLIEENGDELQLPFDPDFFRDAD